MTHAPSAAMLLRRRPTRGDPRHAASTDGLTSRQRALLRLQHPAIAEMHVAPNGGATRLVASEPPGPSLADILQWRRTTPFGLSELLDLLRPVVDGLEHAARHGIAHGSLHPGAIIDSRSGPVLIGFDASAAPCLYRAPETMPGHATRRSDVFALGMMVYELLIGQPPNTATEPWRALPPGVDRVLARALSSEPRRRYQSARVFFKALEACQHRRDSHRVLVSRRHAMIASVLVIALAISAVAGLLIGTLL